MPLAHRTAVLLVFAAALAIFVHNVHAVWPFTADDAFITLRYARNLAMGYGPTYNAGRPPIEGCTTFLWMLLLALLHRLGADPVLWTKLLGIVFTLACAFIVARTVYEVADRQPHWIRLLYSGFTVLCLAGYTPTAVHAVSGMETALFTLLLSGMVYGSHRFLIRPSHQTIYGVTVTGLLIGLTRPEGNLAVVVALGTVLLLTPPVWRVRLGRTAVVLYALPLVGYIGWRWMYYGHLLPLPYYIKLGSPGRLAGLPCVVDFVYHLCLYSGLLVVLGLIRTPRSLVPSLAMSGVLLLFFVFPEHRMGYNWRFLAPLAPFAFVLSSLGLSTIQGFWKAYAASVRKMERTLFAGAMITIFALVPAKILKDTKLSIGVQRRYADGLRDAHVWLGRCLAQFREYDHPPVLAISDAGACTYYSGWQTIDTLGLNEPHIAISGTHEPAYILAQHPDAVVVLSASPTSFTELIGWERPIYESCVEEGMERAVVARFDDGYYLWVFVPPHGKLGRYLRSRSISGAARLAVDGSRAEMMTRNFASERRR
jgi:arabinofuranosyltransferase